MKRLTQFLAVTILAAGLSATDAFAQCNAAGQYQQDPRFYDHIRNGVPASPDSCWNKTSAVAINSTSSCGWSSNAFEFNGYAQQIDQTFSTSGGNSSTSWSLSYLLDFDDPNNSAAWNKFEARVYDQNMTLLASDYYDGGMTDLTCTRRSITFTGSPTSITVMFKGSRGWSNTNIRVRGISLWQGP